MSTTAEATKHAGKTKQAAEEQDKPVPAPIELVPDRFINREISWLAFNDRVLGEANNVKHPLLERLRFLSISASNLDEFIMVRVAALKAQVRAGVKAVTPDNLLPEQQLALINQAITKLNEAQQRCFQNLRTELREAGITVVDPAELSKDDRAWAEVRFLREIFPVLTPIAVDPAHPFPFIANRGVALVLQLSDPEKSEPLDAMIPLPNQLDRFIRMPGAEARFIQLEHLVLMFLDKIFPKPLKLTAHGLFRVLRDSEIDIDEELEDLVRTFETALKRRRRGVVISLAVESDMSQDLREFLVSELRVSTDEMFVQDGLIALGEVRQLILNERTDLLFPPFTARFPERIRDFGGNCFAAIRHKDIVVHHPYESFDVVVQFLLQAARDPAVVAIKQTLYRTSKNSPIVAALIEAAEAGKSVTAMVELKARFDEEANIQWARDLERAGVHVVYGFVDLKTHAKVSLVMRREADGLHSYVHFGTGNYHPITAKVYTDLSFFTCDPALCLDASVMFNYMTGYAKPQHLEKLAIAPLMIRPKIVQLIDTRDRARQSRPQGCDLGQAELAGRSRHHRQAVRGVAGRRPDRPDHPGHLLPSSGRERPVGEHPGQEHRRPLPGAQPHPVRRRRPRPALPQGQGLHLLRRLDAAQPGPPDRDAGADRERDGPRADRRADHGHQPARHGAELDHGIRRVLHPHEGRPGSPERPHLLHAQPEPVGARQRQERRPALIAGSGRQNRSRLPP